ncbi:MAG: hypothetical protein ACLQBK_05085 [Candidatus Sulfotelmatobacter sp.]
MGPGASLSLFHCDTLSGNRAKEEQFQWYIVSRVAGNGLDRVSVSQLERLIASARENQYDHPTIAALAKLLDTSLEKEAYELYVDDILGFPIAIACFFEDYARPDESSVDFQGTKTLHYPKYCVYKFASFLDLLRPRHIRWRGDAELDSDPFARKALEQFKAEDSYGKAAILARWIKQPGGTAFSEKRARQSDELHKRREFLKSLPHLALPILAAKLDDRFPKTRGKFPSYTAWLRKSPDSFASWVSNERKKELRLSRRSSPRIR